ncbi:MAG: iron ABC transporter permease [Bacteroidales bacterium]
MKKVANIPLLIMLGITGVITGLFSLVLGRYPVSLADLWHMVTPFQGAHADISPQLRTVVAEIRLPRIIAAFLVGGTLSITGAAYQGMFRNPMVSPSLLGVSAGAGFGAALGILLGLSPLIQQGMSFVFGVGAVAAVYAISLFTGVKHDKCLTLILAGMIVATLFTALISILKYVADPDNTLPSIVYWLMGGLAATGMTDLRYIGVFALVGLAVLTLSGWKIDMLSFGDEEAKTMGIRVDRFRLLVIVIATLMTASAVSISGIIGWVGLIIPHITRMITGPRNTELLPASFLIGGTFLLVIDGFSRSVAAVEIPLGITTSLIGAPFFIFIMMKTSKKHHHDTT